MKKTLLIAAIAAMVLGCDKEVLTDQPLQEEGQASLALDFTINDGSSLDTRVVKQGWALNDKIYILFDKEINYGADNPAQYLVIAFGDSDKKWHVVSWSAGLERKIANKTSGTLTALYMPNDKVGGTISFEHGSSEQYNVYSKDRNAGKFKSFALVAENQKYTVSGGVLKASLTLKAPNTTSSWMQHCIDNKDRNGNTIPNSESHHYTLQHRVMSYQNSGSYGDLGYTRSVSPYTYTNSGIFNFDTFQEMSAYVSGGLCFAGYNASAKGERMRHIFTLVDNKGTATTADDVTYQYIWPETGNYGQLTSSAIKLPALNAKNSSGNYKWVQQQ